MILLKLQRMRDALFFFFFFYVYMHIRERNTCWTRSIFFLFVELIAVDGLFGPPKRVSSQFFFLFALRAPKAGFFFLLTEVFLSCFCFTSFAGFEALVLKLRSTRKNNKGRSNKKEKGDKQVAGTRNRFEAFFFFLQPLFSLCYVHGKGWQAVVSLLLPSFYFCEVRSVRTRYIVSAALLAE